MSKLHYCGIDIAKQSFVVAFHDRQKTAIYDNSLEGITHFVALLSRWHQCGHHIELIAVEASGATKKS